MVLNNDFPTESNLLLIWKKKCELPSKSADIDILLERYNIFTFYPHLFVSNIETLFIS